MKLYKFRSLANCKDLKRAIEILETGEFWCSHYWELNDPMEGVYSYNDALSNDDIHKLYDEKSNYVICSFSGAKAFTNPLVWGYYANGFKGIAIEIEVNGDEQCISEINYASKVLNINNNDSQDENVKRILTTKLCCWAHEDEYRYLTIGSPDPKKIGTITAVYYGKPYITKVNAPLAKERSRIQEYLSRIELLKKKMNQVNEEKEKKIQFQQVEIVDGEVQAQENNQDNETVDS